LITDIAALSQAPVAERPIALPPENQERVMREPHHPPYYRTNKEALEAISAGVRDINEMIKNSLRTIEETHQMLAWIDTWSRSGN